MDASSGHAENCFSSVPVLGRNYPVRTGIRIRLARTFRGLETDPNPRTTFGQGQTLNSLGSVSSMDFECHE